MWKARSRWALARTVFEPQSKKSEHPGSSANSLRSSKAPLRLCVFVVKAGHAHSPLRRKDAKNPRHNSGRRVQLEVGVTSGPALVNSIRLFWSAATCRRFRSDAGAIAATSRRTPYRTRYLSVLCAHSAAETDSRF